MLKTGKSIIYFAIVIVLLVLMIVLVITGGNNKSLSNTQETAVQSSTPTPDPYSLSDLSAEDAAMYNIPEDAIIIDADDYIPQDQGGEYDGYNIPEGSVIIDEDQAGSIPDGYVIVEDGSDLGDYFVPADAVIIDEGSSAPAGELISSGSISSNTGTVLNLVADWEACVYDYDNAKLIVYVSISHSSLTMSSVPSGVSVTVNGQTSYLNVPSVNFSGGMTSTSVGSCSFVVPVRTSSVKEYPIRVDWSFGGSYSGVRLDTITASGSAVISR